MEQPKQQSEICWRKQVDQNLKRLHSLLFGIDIALEKHDFSSAQILSLRLLGFLDSRTNDESDDVFINPIRRDVASKLDFARKSLANESDRLVIQQARRERGDVFLKKGEIDIEKVKQSKYFKVLVHKLKGRTVDAAVCT
ncbi:Fidgetin-like protein 1 [Ranunculus cassubicifolius]